LSPQVLHLQDGRIGPTRRRVAQMRVDHLAHHDMVVALLDDALHPALDRADRGIQDRLAARGAAQERLPRQHAVLQLRRLEEGERQVLLLLPSMLSAKVPAVSSAA
jgi:hypothetical protein